MVSCKWNCFPSGKCKKQPFDPAGDCFCASLEHLSFGPSKHNFFVLCPWAVFPKPVSTLVWLWLVKRMYMKPVMEKAIAAKTHNCSFVHGTACLVCSDIMVPCDWLHYRAPSLPHYWQLLSTSSYCYYLIGLLFISAFDFSFLNAANCTGLLALMFWTLLEFYPT